MSKELDYRNGARVIVETCMGIKPKEKVLIIFTKDLYRNVKLLAEEAEALSAQVTLSPVDNKDMQIRTS